MKPIKKPAVTGLVTTSGTLNFKAKLKQFVMQMACYELIPLAMADWLITNGGLNND